MFKNIAKIFFLLIIAIGFFWTQPTNAAGWFANSSGVTNSLLAVDFLDYYTGLAVGSSGVILKYSQGDANWSSKSSGVTATLYDVDQIFSSTAFAVGAGGVILKTTNGSTSWVQQTSGTTADLYRVKFITGNANVGYAVGKSGTIIKTTNGGSTWVSLASGTTSNLLGLAISPDSSSIIWAVGQSGTVLYSDDAGSTWVKKLPFSVYDLYAVDAISSDTVLALGAYAAGSNYPILRSTNGGATWSVAYTSSVPLRGLDVKGSVSFVVGGAGGAAGKIFKSSDGGVSWAASTNSTAGGPLFGVAVLTARVFAVGSDGIVLEYDETPPTTPSNLTKTTADNDNTPAFQWSGSIDYSGYSGSYYGSGINNYEYSIDAGSYVNNGLNLTVTLGSALANGPHVIQVRAVDAVGNVGDSASLAFTINVVTDVTPPTGSVSINNGATATNSTGVTLSLSCTDDVGCPLMQVAVDGTADTESWGIYSTNPSATLSSGDETKTVAVRFKDGAGNISEQYTDTIILDTAAPNVSLPTPSTALSGVAQTFSVTFSDGVGVTSCKFFVGSTEQGTMTLSGSATAGTATFAYTFPSAVGYSSYVKCYDAAGNFGHSGYNSVSVYPTGTVSINGGAASTNNPTATLTLVCKDNNVDCYQMKIAVDGTVDNEPWETFSATKAVTLPSGDGLKTVAVKFYGKAGGNISEQITDTITLSTVVADTTSPIVGAITPATAQATVSQSFTASYSDAVGVVSCDLYVDSSNQGPMTLSGTKAGTASRSYTFINTASHTLQARCSDEAGNVGLGNLVTVSVSAAPVAAADTAAPTTPSGMKKVSDDSDKTPTFTWNSSSDNTGVTSYVIQVDNGSLIDIGGAQTYTVGSLFDGSHTIKVFAKDAAGNSSPVSSFTFTVDTSTPAPTPVSCSLTINGAYKLTGSPAVYYITDECNKRPFSKSNVFFTYFNSWSDVTVTTKTKLDKIPLDTLGFMPWGPKYDPKYGALVKIVTDPKVYLLLGGEKYWITAEEIFTGLNYSWDWVEDIDKELLDKYVTGSEINYTDHHPSYTLIKYAASTKIYRLEPDPADTSKQVKRYIKNEAVFNALNFRWDRIVTISKSEVYKDGEVLSEEDI
ncbi:MAG: hypothetical protein HY980_01415 [Candidatus Magasanikbacteria bacterium]|nr:hypothetical protein [Candidatus Magasanikbacteria bacterium]